MRQPALLFLPFTLLFLSSILTYAQPPQRLSPEERAERQTTMMTDSLSLSEAQIERIQEVNLKYTKQTQEARNQNRGDWEAMREAMSGIMQARREEMKTYLTEDQYQKWVDLEEAQATRRRSRMNRNRNNE